MELVGILMVAHKEHVADQGIEPIAQVAVFLRCLVGKGCFHLALGVKLWAHTVAAVLAGFKIGVFHTLCLVAEQAFEHPVGDEGLGEQFFLEMKAIGFDFLACQTEGRRELSQQSVNGIYRNLPYPEESKHMVDAVGVKIFRHVGEAAHPPLAVVLEHLVPVVGGKSPVLSVDREVVWWCSCLSVEVEVARLLPHVASMAVHADGDVALEHHALGAGIVVGLLHLAAQHILHEVVEGHVLVGRIACAGQGAAVGLVERLVVGPL